GEVVRLVVEPQLVDPAAGTGGGGGLGGFRAPGHDWHVLFSFFALSVVPLDGFIRLFGCGLLCTDEKDTSTVGHSQDHPRAPGVKTDREPGGPPVCGEGSDEHLLPFLQLRGVFWWL